MEKQTASGTGKVTGYARNGFRNLRAFVKALLQLQDLSWGHERSKAAGCRLEEKVVLYKPYCLQDVQVGLGTYIAVNSRISFTTIGRFCSIGPGFLCGWGIHPVNGISTSPVFYSTGRQVGFTYADKDKIRERKRIEIGHDVFIGANVVVLDGVKIGHGAVIGAGAVVSKDIPPYAIAVGNPIQVIRYRFEPTVIDRLLQLEWWNRGEEMFRQVEADFFDVEAFLRKTAVPAVMAAPAAAL